MLTPITSPELLSPKPASSHILNQPETPLPTFGDAA